MRTQTYHFTKFERDANIKNNRVALQVNCAGVVSYDYFENRSVREDFYYIYVRKGKMILPNYSLLPGDALLLEPGHPYYYKAEGPTEYLWVHFTGFDARTISLQAFPELNAKQHLGIQSEIIDCFQKLFREFMINDADSKQLQVHILREILLLTARYANTPKHSQMPLQAIEYIHQHYREELDITSLARMENKS